MCFYLNKVNQNKSGANFVSKLTENLSHIVSPWSSFTESQFFLIRQRMRRDRWQPSDRRLGNRGSAENRRIRLRRCFGFGSLRRLRKTSRQKKLDEKRKKDSLEMMMIPVFQVRPISQDALMKNCLTSVSHFFVVLACH